MPAKLQISITLSIVFAASALPVPANQLELEAGERIIFLGGTFFDRARSHGFLETLLTAQYPHLHLKFRNMGWPGDTAQVQLRPLNFGSLEDHLRAQKASLVFLAYGMSEATAGPAGLDDFREACQRLVELVQTVGARPVLVSPIRHQKSSSPSARVDLHNSHLRRYIREMRDLARTEGLPFVNLFEDLPGGAAPLTDNGIHLNERGYWLSALAILRGVGLPHRPWEVQVDLRRGTVESSGTNLTVTSLELPLRFRTLDEALPLRHPAGVDRSSQQRQLSVTGLPPGSYQILIDGGVVLQAGHHELTRGVPVVDGPEYRQAGDLRKLILKKNRHFFHRWRAQNGEYIYGRRSMTDRHIYGDQGGDLDGRGNAGNSQFEEEMAEFDRLIRELEAEIHLRAQPQPHRYELKPLRPHTVTEPED